jgi:hypothetical protein
MKRQESKDDLGRHVSYDLNIKEISDIITNYLVSTETFAVATGSPVKWFIRDGEVSGLRFLITLE